MKKRVIAILAMIVLGVPGLIFAEDVIQGEVILQAPANTGLQKLSVPYPREWYIIEKIPNDKGLTIGVWLFEQGMPIEHIRSVFGEPLETISLEMEEGFFGTIWVYPHHDFFFSKTGRLETIKDRNLQADSSFCKAQTLRR